VSFKTIDIITDLHLEKMAEVAIEFADRHIIHYSAQLLGRENILYYYLPDRGVGDDVRSHI